MKLFGTAGIRGRINEYITPEFALQVGEAFGCYLGQGARVAVGRDSRFGAQSIAMAFIAGLNSQGVNVDYCDIIPTPGIASYIVDQKIPGGAMITGSHTPPEISGIVLMNPDGSDIGGENAEKIEKIFETRKYVRTRCPMQKFGGSVNLFALNVYAEILKESADFGKIRKRKFRVLVDTANGCAHQILPKLLIGADCEVFSINSIPSPTPARMPEPRRHTLQSSAKQVKAEGCDIGVATDTDADRVLFITGDGEVVSEDVVAAIFAREILSRKKGKIVTPINSSGLIYWVAQQFGVEVIATRVGPPEISIAMRANPDTVFAYEETGKYFFLPRMFADGLLSTFKLLEILVDREKTLKELSEEFPKFYQRKEALHCEEGLKKRVMKRVFEMLKNEFPGEKIITIDGYKVCFEDNAWLLVRKSGTEPLVRVFSDAPSETQADGLVQKGLQILEEAIRAEGERVGKN
ncbi:MAG: phosphoglucomutase [Thermoplasmata archaeon]|nr:phosphoglucomutase [Thermoplasmata archaeon]